MTPLAYFGAGAAFAWLFRQWRHRPHGQGVVDFLADLALGFPFNAKGGAL